MKKKLGLATWAAATVGLMGVAKPTEYGNSHADLGYIDTLAGLPLTPGFYLRDDVNIQNNNRLNNGSGNPVNLNIGDSRVGVKFRNSIEADVLAVAYVPNWKVPYIDATIGFAAYEFIGNSRAEVATQIGLPEASANSKAGFGDLTVVPFFLGFNIPNTDLHFVFSPFEFTAPTGRYSPSDPIGNNVGLNYWSYRPALEFTYLNKTGQEFDINMGASINSQNPATHYKSGDEFYFTYAFQQYISPRFALGIGGYYYKQVGDDTQNGAVVDSNPLTDFLGAGPGNRGETFAVGPIVSYNLNYDITFQAHWDHEVFSYNRPQRDQYWIRGAVKF